MANYKVKYRHNRWSFVHLHRSVSLVLDLVYFPFCLMVKPFVLVCKVFLSLCKRHWTWFSMRATDFYYSLSTMWPAVFSSKYSISASYTFCSAALYKNTANGQLRFRSDIRGNATKWNDLRDSVLPSLSWIIVKYSYLL